MPGRKKRVKLSAPRAVHGVAVRLPVAGSIGLSNCGTKTFAPNSNFQYATGHTFKRKEKDFLGVIASLTYNKSFNYNETNIKSYVSSSNNETVSLQENDYLTKTYSNKTLAAALANFNVKLNEMLL